MAGLMLFTSLLIALAIWCIAKTAVVYHEARKLGLPIVITPVERIIHPVWAILLIPFAPLIRRLPYNLGEFVDFELWEWRFRHRNKHHERLGPIFLVVNTSGIKLMLADGDACEDMLRRYKEFIKPEILYKPLDLFGENVDTVNGEKWQRHRKITAPSFNERNSNLVWKESLSQAKGMLHKWTSDAEPNIVASIHADTTTLALHVITGAGFGKKLDYNDVSKPGHGHHLSFKEAMETVLLRIIAVFLTSAVPTKLTNLLPNKLNPLLKIETAIQEFRQYLVEMVNEQRATLSERTQEQDTLVSALLRAAELEETHGKGKNTLSNDEIYGNLFIYSFAGHDTTANSLHYACILLADDETRQAWLKEEIQTVIGNERNVIDREYKDTFPKLKRCLAVMFETLRLYGPVTSLPRTTDTTPLSLKVKGKDYIIPPHTMIMQNIFAIHTDPEVWGSDSYEWKPERWIVKRDGFDGIENEELMTPPAGYIPWASGARVCPGRKFAQVEFVAVVATIMAKHHVRVDSLDRETRKQTSERVHDALLNSRVLITLKMVNPEKVKLVWEED